MLSFQFPALSTAVLSFQQLLPPSAAVLRRRRLFPASFPAATPTAALASLRSVDPRWSWPHPAIHAPARATTSVCDTVHRRPQQPRVTARPATSSAAPATAALALSFSLQICPPFVHLATACIRNFLDFRFCP